jgi:hypothetical protein
MRLPSISTSPAKGAAPLPSSTLALRKSVLLMRALSFPLRVHDAATPRAIEASRRRPAVLDAHAAGRN